MAEIHGLAREAGRTMISMVCPLQMRTLEQLSVNLAPSVELQTAAVIGCRSKVAQIRRFPEFPFSIQTTAWLAAVWVSYYEQQTEDKLGCVRTPQRNTVFRMFRAP